MLETRIGPKSEERRETVLLFRARLTEAMERVGLSKSSLARETGIDRSTITQLLTSEPARLPRADTVASVAKVLKVSLDWLLGLSSEERPHAGILQEHLMIAPTDRSPVDENLAEWQAAAVGQKLRYVPATLPDLFKTEAVLEHEFKDYAVKTTDQAKAASEGQLALSRMPSADMEICMAQQTLLDFADGAGIWRGMANHLRQEQLAHIAAMTEELYPKLRLFLFDGLTHFAAPYTIFGVERAAVYMGQMYFAFTTQEHVRTLTNHFDDLIRSAIVHSHEASDYVRSLNRP